MRLNALKIDSAPVGSTSKKSHCHAPGAYLGGGALGHGLPLWVARNAKLHRKVSKIKAWPLLFASWILDLISQRVCCVRFFQALGEKWNEI